MSNGSCDLVKLPAFQRMLDDFCIAVGVTVAIVDPNGEVLARHDPPRICKSFCSVFPGRCSGCFKHDPGRLQQACAGGGPVILTARGGMVDAVTPVDIPELPGAHAVIGPMFLEKTDLEFFRSEAMELGLDVPDWMDAASEIPVISRARLGAIIDMLPAFFEIAGTMDQERVRARTDLAAAGARLQHVERTEQELRESEEKFAAVFHTNALSIVISRLDDGHIIDVNQAFEQVTGYSRQEALGRTTLDIGFWLDPNTRAAVFSQLQTAETVNYEFVMRRRDGQLRTMIGSTRKLGIAGELCIASVFTDITERKLTELALRESEARHRTYFETAADAIVVVRARDGLVTDCNARAVTQLGCERREQIVGVHAMTFCPPTQPDGTPSLDKARALMRSAKGGHLQFFEWEFQRRDGTRFLAEVSVNELVAGADMEVLVIGRDISERRQLEDRLRQVQRIEALGQLAGGVAHDVNNLLTPIIGYATLLQHRIGKDDPLRADACAIVEAGGRCRDVVKQLLTFARRQTLRTIALNLNDVVGSFRETVIRSLREHVQVSLRLDGAPATIMGDPGQIEQVILNLALNAQDAMPDGGQLDISTSRETIGSDADLQHVGMTPGPYVVLSVRDTGTGMDEATKARAIEPFFTTKGSGKGTGLGLATVHGIVKQHGGHLIIDSTVGKGTTIRVYFPYREEQKPALQVPPASEQPVAVGHETILVVEDHDDVRAITTELLGRSGYRVIEARDGASAQRIIAEQKIAIDLLLTDVVLPDTNGRTLHERLARSRPGLRVLYMSGYPADIVGRHGSADPNAVYLQKPFMPEDLAKKVRQALNADGTA